MVRSLTMHLQIQIYISLLGRPKLCLKIKSPKRKYQNVFTIHREHELINVYIVDVARVN